MVQITPTLVALLLVAPSLAIPISTEQNVEARDEDLAGREPRWGWFRKAARIGRTALNVASSLAGRDDMPESYERALDDVDFEDLAARDPGLWDQAAGLFNKGTQTFHKVEGVVNTAEGVAHKAERVGNKIFGKKRRHRSKRDLEESDLTERDIEELDLSERDLEVLQEPAERDPSLWSQAAGLFDKGKQTFHKVEVAVNTVEGVAHKAERVGNKIFGTKRRHRSKRDIEEFDLTERDYTDSELDQLD